MVLKSNLGGKVKLRLVSSFDSEQVSWLLSDTLTAWHSSTLCSVQGCLQDLVWLVQNFNDACSSSDTFESLKEKLQRKFQKAELSLKYSLPEENAQTHQLNSEESFLVRVQRQLQQQKSSAHS